jgi:hypothetical protein
MWVLVALIASFVTDFAAQTWNLGLVGALAVFVCVSALGFFVVLRTIKLEKDFVEITSFFGLKRKKIFLNNITSVIVGDNLYFQKNAKNLRISPPYEYSRVTTLSLLFNLKDGNHFVRTLDFTIEGLKKLLTEMERRGIIIESHVYEKI